MQRRKEAGVYQTVAPPRLKLVGQILQLVPERTGTLNAGDLRADLRGITGRPVHGQVHKRTLTRRQICTPRVRTEVGRAMETKAKSHAGIWQRGEREVEARSRDRCGRRRRSDELRQKSTGGLRRDSHNDRRGPNHGPIGEMDRAPVVIDRRNRPMGPHSHTQPFGGSFDRPHNSPHPPWG